MITLDQIQSLDAKVQQAVEVIDSLRKENGILKQKLSSYEDKISELEVLVEGFKSDQGEIEEGIQKALKRLDLISDRPAAPAAEHKEAPVSETSVEESPEAETEDEEAALLEETEEDPPSPYEEISETAGEESKPAELDIF